MNVDTQGKYLTLDWDNISKDVAINRVQEICDSDPNLEKLQLSRSPTKGFHCRIYFFRPVNIVEMRHKLNDDPRRLLNDILNRPAHIHDILWSRKTIHTIPYEEEHLITINNPRVI